MSETNESGPRDRRKFSAANRLRIVLAGLIGVLVRGLRRKRRLSARFVVARPSRLRARQIVHVGRQPVRDVLGLLDQHG